MLLRVVLTGSCGDVAQEAQSTYCLCELHSSNGISPLYAGRKGHLSEMVGGLGQLSGRVSTPLRHILQIEDVYVGTSRRGKPGAPVLVALRLVVVCADSGCFGGYLAHGCGWAVFGVPGAG